MGEGEGEVEEEREKAGVKGKWQKGVSRKGEETAACTHPLCWDVSALEADEPFDRELRRRVGVWAGVEPPWVGAGDLALVVLEGPALFSEAPGDLTASRDLSDLAEALERVEALERPERLDLVEDALDLVDRLDLAEALDLAEVADLAECSETSLPQGESDLIPRSEERKKTGCINTRRDMTRFRDKQNNAGLCMNSIGLMSTDVAAWPRRFPLSVRMKAAVPSLRFSVSHARGASWQSR